MSDVNKTNDDAETFVKIVVNADGFEMRMDRDGIKWPERPRKYDSEMGAQIEKHIAAQTYWLRKWKEGNDLAINYARKEGAAHNSAQWGFHLTGVIGSGTAAKVSKETLLELFKTELAKGNIKLACETADLYVKKLTNTECKTLLLEVCTNKDLVGVKDKVMNMITDRIQDLLIKKAERKS